MTALKLTLRGAFRVSDGAGHAMAGLSRRGLVILAALASADGMRLGRTTLATLAWGDRGEEQARASLRQELSVLRRALPEGTLHADRLSVWLDQDLCVADRTGAGGFLEDLDIASPEFEDWLRDTRAGLSRQWAGERLAAARSALAAAQPERAEALAGEVLDSDPLNEAAMQVVLRAAACGAGMAAALLRFQDFRERLRRDLDVEPGVETMALAAALRLPAAPVEATPAVRRPAAVGESPSLAVLPFDEIGGRPEEMLADGIVEEITNALSRVHDFHVIARQSAFALHGSGLAVPETAARLGCDYLSRGRFSVPATGCGCRYSSSPAEMGARCGQRGSTTMSMTFSTCRTGSRRKSPVSFHPLCAMPRSPVPRPCRPRTGPPTA